MGLITTEPRSSPHPLSPRLVHELGDPHSTLRATTDGSGAALLDPRGRRDRWPQRASLASIGHRGRRRRHGARTAHRRRHRARFHGLLRFRRTGRRGTTMSVPRHRPASGEPPADRRPDRRSGWAEPSAAHLPDRRYCARQGHGRSSPLLIPAVRAPSRPPVAPPLGPIAPPRDDVRVRRACGIACLAR